ncbi:MAG: enoyl-CoA hydratase/isomerase family protein [Pseudomonadales bacterium]|nr:enoyl-CoA hydratase/isomerase family protein [Pseudomonadales bacterium]
MSQLPNYEFLELTRSGRLLTIAMQRPELLNAVNLTMLQELAQVFTYAAADKDSDVVVLTGAGKAFSAGGDLDHILGNAENPEQFEYEARLAKQIVFSMLDLEKPLIAKLNGHAVGLGATLALMCDVIFASEKAKIGDPHVALGLVAGDGGAAIWPQRIGFGRAKEFLLTGELLTANHAEQIGLINHSVSPEELDERVSAFCDKLLNGATKAIRWTKVLVNLELKRIVHSVLDTGLAYEALSAHSADHKEGVKALQEKRKPEFGK